MNKFLKLLMCAGLCGTMVLAAACTGGGDDGESPTPDDNNKTQQTDPESVALALSLSAPDGNFNPFFYTSLSDGQVINMTQASLISSDYDAANNKVNVAYGDDHPTVAKDYKVTYYDSRTGGSVTNSAGAANGGRTEYEFLIKKGMKFSNGEELTIRDVLFNFYVYLDTAYTGSNTMYSVDIQGLTAYQENNSTYGLDGEADLSQYVLAAQGRMNDLIEYANGKISATTQITADAAKVRELYREELNSDWTSIESSWSESYKTNYSFTEAWQAYLFQEGIVTAQMIRRADGTSFEVRVDENNNIIDPSVSAEAKEAYANATTLTTLDPYVAGAGTPVGGEPFRQTEIDEIAEATSQEEINQYIADNGGDAANARLQLSKAYCIDRVYREYLQFDSGLADVLTYWATGSSAYNYFLADERSAALEDNTNAIYYIQGLQTYSTTSFNNKDLGESYDVLKIVINDVDPAAIWQFGISIAPISYYSGTWDGVNYITKATGYQVKNGDPVTTEDSFGVKRGSVDFFENVLKQTDSSKNGVPVGAGPYKASTYRGGEAGSKSQFFDNNIVYYERNTNFETMGENIDNAKIKYLRYKVVDDDSIISSVLSGDLHYGEPTANITNQTRVTENLDTNGGNLGQFAYNTSGYGYVGINPTYVPDIEIRRIIMKAMPTNLALTYYGSNAEPIYRPMSLTSWAYPQGETTYAGLEPYQSSSEIAADLDRLGYYDNGSGVREKNGFKLKLTFSIAGANTDHPAYNMFQEAAKLLNQAGFDISVSTDVSALQKLTKGQLAVWAAAWSSGVDPDMYQVYHKDSNATSVLNWGYRTILNGSSSYDYSYEATLIDQLSDLIDEGRMVLEEDARMEIYAEALDVVMEMAVELPVYQRKDLCIYNTTILDKTTLNQNPNAYTGVMDRIWEVNYL